MMVEMALHDHYRAEAADCLGIIEAAPVRARREAALNEVWRAARTLGGMARLAGEQRVVRAARALEEAARQPTGLGLDSSELEAELRVSAADLRLLVDGAEPPAELDARALRLVERWHAASSGEGNPAPAPRSDNGEFRAFVAREAAGIVEILETAVAAFSEDPSNREMLGATLRRQRALLGAARLNEITVVAETLHAVDDLSELIVRLGVPIKSEWLDVFRSAREVLRASAASLEKGESPSPTPSLSRLRTLRQELVDRYGNREVPPTEAQAAAARELTGASDGSSAASASAPTAPVSPRERAAALHATVVRALGADRDGRNALDELYNLLLRNML